MTFSNHTAGPIPEDAGNSQGSPGSRQPLRASLTGCFSPFPAGQRLCHAHQHLRPEPLPARRHLPPEREPQGRLQVTAHPWPTLPWASGEELALRVHVPTLGRALCGGGCQALPVLPSIQIRKLRRQREEVVRLVSTGTGTQGFAVAN